MAKYNKKHKRYAPRIALIIPCKNLDENFEQNIASFYRQDYENYLLWFVVEDKTDPAYDQLCRLKDKLAGSTKAATLGCLLPGLGRSAARKSIIFCMLIAGFLKILRRWPLRIRISASSRPGCIIWSILFGILNQKGRQPAIDGSFPGQATLPRLPYRP